MVNEIVAATVGGFAGWVAIQAVAYHVVRSRVIAYVNVQVNIHLHGIGQNIEWLRDVVKQHSHPGVIPQNQPRFSPDHAEDLHECREFMLRYLNRSEIERVTKFLSYLWEVEYLIQGICETLCDLTKRAAPMKGDDCDHLEERVSRIESVTNKWPLSIDRLDQLPNDYAGVKSAKAVPVPPTKQTSKESPSSKKKRSVN